MSQQYKDEIRETVIDGLRNMADPIDFDRLVEIGALERIGRSKSRFKVIDMARLPKSARAKITSINSDGVAEFKGPTKAAGRLLGKIDRA